MSSPSKNPASVKRSAESSSDNPEDSAVATTSAATAAAAASDGCGHVSRSLTKPARKMPRLSSKPVTRSTARHLPANLRVSAQEGLYQVEGLSSEFKKKKRGQRDLAVDNRTPVGDSSDDEDGELIFLSKMVSECMITDVSDSEGTVIGSPGCYSVVNCLLV